MTITVYSKPACVQCTATTRALEARGLDYQVIDLTEDDAALPMSRTGLPASPRGGRGRGSLGGFRPDLIGRLA